MCPKFDLPDIVLGFVLQANLRDALGIDIAGQLRKHFLAAMQSPSQAAAAAAASMAAASNLAWLSNAAGTSGTASAAQMQAAAAALAASTASPPGVASAPSTSQAVTTETAATLSSGRPVAEAPGSAAAAAAQAAAAQSAAGVEDPAGCSRQANGRISPRIDPRTGKQIVQCEICHKILADPSSLYRHRKIHSGDKPHQCPFCDRRFIQRYGFSRILRDSLVRDLLHIVTNPKFKEHTDHFRDCLAVNRPFLCCFCLVWQLDLS